MLAADETTWSIVLYVAVQSGTGTGSSFHICPSYSSSSSLVVDQQKKSDAGIVLCTYLDAVESKAFMTEVYG